MACKFSNRVNKCIVSVNDIITICEIRYHWSLVTLSNICYNNETFMIVINSSYFLLLYSWFAKCLAEEGSIYTQRAMVSASLHLYTCQADNFDLLGPFWAVVVSCKPYNQ